MYCLLPSSDLVNSPLFKQIKTRGEILMNRDEIREKVKALICKVTGFETDEIGDSASFQDDLELDSLALIEIAVEVGYAYKLKLTEEEMLQLKTLDDAVQMVSEKLDETDAEAVA